MKKRGTTNSTPPLWSKTKQKIKRAIYE